MRIHGTRASAAAAVARVVKSAAKQELHFSFRDPRASVLQSTSVFHELSPSHTQYNLRMKKTLSAVAFASVGQNQLMSYAFSIVPMTTTTPHSEMMMMYEARLGGIQLFSTISEDSNENSNQNSKSRRDVLWDAGLAATVFAGVPMAAFADGSQICEDPEAKIVSIFERAGPSVVYIDTFTEQRDVFSPNVQEVVSKAILCEVWISLLEWG